MKDRARKSGGRCNSRIAMDGIAIAALAIEEGLLRKCRPLPRRVRCARRQRRQLGWSFSWPAEPAVTPAEHGGAKSGEQRAVRCVSQCAIEVHDRTLAGTLV